MLRWFATQRHWNQKDMVLFHIRKERFSSNHCLFRKLQGRSYLLNVFINSVTQDLISSFHFFKIVASPVSCGEKSACAKAVFVPELRRESHWELVISIASQFQEAERAIEQMNGQWLGRRTIRTNWATRKPTSTGAGDGQYGRTELNYDDVFNQTGPDNTSVYVGNVNSNANGPRTARVYVYKLY